MISIGFVSCLTRSTLCCEPGPGLISNPMGPFLPKASVNGYAAWLTDPEGLCLTDSPGHIRRRLDVFKDSPDVIPWHGDVIEKHVIASLNVF